MFMPFMFLLIMLSVPLLGGHMRRMGDIRVSWVPLVVGALAIQILITSVITSAPAWLLVTLHLVTYVMAAVFLWRNRALRGLAVVGAGVLSNGITIALNAGTLPASAHALRAAGYPVGPSNFANSGVLAHPVLPWLGDILATPSWLPFRNVISVGDLLILVGAAILMHAACQSVLWRMVTGRRSAGAAGPAVAA